MTSLHFLEHHSTGEVIGAFCALYLISYLPTTLSITSKEKKKAICCPFTLSFVSHIPRLFLSPTSRYMPLRNWLTLLNCVWIQISFFFKCLWCFLAAGRKERELSTGNLTTLKKHLYRLCNQCAVYCLFRMGRVPFRQFNFHKSH